MIHGKNICKQLKEVRKRIAEENDIPLEIKECTYKGECRGTCPRCEAEVQYLENALANRLRIGKVATVAGLALGLASCGNGPSSAQGSKTQLTTDTTPGGTVSAQENRVQLTPHISIDAADTAGLNIGDVPLVGYVQETDPEFPGGYEALHKFIQDNLHYPKKALQKRIEGRVYVTFVVERDGTITNPRILRDIGGGCGAEAIRLVKKMPKWLPGRQLDTVVVRVQYNLPIEFKLPEEEKNKQQ